MEAPGETDRLGTVTKIYHMRDNLKKKEKKRKHEYQTYTQEKMFPNGSLN